MKNLNINFEDKDFEKMKAKKERTGLSWKDAILDAFRRLG